MARWLLVDSSYGTVIQRDDSPDDGIESAPDDDTALEWCIEDARKGDAAALDALADIAREYHEIVYDLEG